MMRRCVCFLVLFMAGVSIFKVRAQDHAFTVRSDIEMIRFSDPLALPGLAGSEIARRSPDGKHFAVVTTRGLLQSNLIESSISLFDQQTLETFLRSPSSARPPKPRVVATIRSFPHHEEPYPYAPVIKDLRWAPDLERIYFRGEGQGGTYRLYEAKIDGSYFHALTPPRYSVSRYDILGTTIVYRASEPARKHIIAGDVINADARAVTGYAFQDILFPGRLSTLDPEVFRLWVMKRIHGKYITTPVRNYSIRERNYLSFEFPFVISPKGNFLVEVNPVAAVPRSWERYEPATGFEYLRYRSDDPRLTSDANLYRPRRYTLVDLENGKQLPLVNAPNAMSLIYGYNNRVIWAGNGKRVLITNTFLPLDDAPTAQASLRLRPCVVASVEVPSLQTRCLLFDEKGVSPENTVGQVQEVSFGSNDDEVVVVLEREKGEAVQKYGFGEGRWQLISSRPSDSSWSAHTGSATENNAGRNDLQIVVRQDLNDPPTLWVSNQVSAQGRQLWDPNPDFAHIRFGAVSEYRWQDGNGHGWTAGLVKPVGYVAGKHYPLVIQMYMFFDHQFMTDGTDPTAFAARHLASAGFVVLQIQKKSVHTYNDTEAQDHLEGYRSAIEHLAADGLIDPTRVGVVGFSTTCWYVENALIKAPHLFRAATIADGADHSYMQYHLFSSLSLAVQEQEEKIIGAKPVSAGLNTWLQRAPGFHLDQIQTPLRIEAINPASLLGEWEIYSSLQMQNKPVDLIYFPFGTHIHQRPFERLESQQGDVDWFRFWLQGYEDPDPRKRGEYKRWERLRGGSGTRCSKVNP